MIDIYLSFFRHSRVPCTITLIHALLLRVHCHPCSLHYRGEEHIRLTLVISHCLLKNCNHRNLSILSTPLTLELCFLFLMYSCPQSLPPPFSSYPWPLHHLLFLPFYFWFRLINGPVSFLSTTQVLILGMEIICDSKFRSFLFKEPYYISMTFLYCQMQWGLIAITYSLERGAFLEK